MAAAVEVLTLGSYSRLPAVIREKLVPPPSLTPAERRSTLRALAHVVKQRLTTASLPSDVRNLKVYRKINNKNLFLRTQFLVLKLIIGVFIGRKWKSYLFSWSRI